MRAQVERAVAFAHWREGRTEAGTGIADDFEADARLLLEEVGERLTLGARGLARVSRVARTIADLGEAPLVRAQDVAEAAAFRPQFG